MATTDIDRLTNQAARPRALLLWQALQGLKSCVSFMNTGAHPDDETSAMLAALGLRDGISISYACANRGEGGQNNLGTEVNEDLGVVRTAEMERACDVLNLRMYWLSESPDDSIFDFGFSKSGTETLGKWGKPRALKRFVEIIRQERPDIICPTFLDIPGQHGHHRAMTSLAHEVITAAADPAFAEAELPLWQVKKLYLPAWSGAGDSYDDDAPPPCATVTIEASGEDPFSGWTYEQLGQHSRMFHRSQAMGRWIPPGQERNWSLHLAHTLVAGPDQCVTSGLPATLSDLAEFALAPSIAAALSSAQKAIDTAIQAFPDLGLVRQNASVALGFIRKAISACPAQAREEVIHRLALKEHQLSVVIRLAARVTLRAALDKEVVYPGNSVLAQIESAQGDADRLTLEWLLPDDWSVQENTLTLASAASPSDPYPSRYLPGIPAVPALSVTLEVDGEQSTTRVAPERPPLVMPAVSARLTPTDIVLNTARATRSFGVEINQCHPADASPELKLPLRWSATSTANEVTVSPPDSLEDGLYTLPLQLAGKPVATVKPVAYSHIHSRIRCVRAALKVLAVHTELPDARIAYVGGGNDRVAERLAAIGLPVKQLTDSDLTRMTGLSNIDTLVVGLFAFRTRPVLQQNIAWLHHWVEQGGNLVTLYHRPWDGWQPDATPVRPITIGKPSLRWRICDENAEVTHLLPAHPLLTTPNKIIETDWQGWHKERGLYFASAWDPAYQALLSMADPDEQPHLGGLLSARSGLGRHTHTSLILHHQMEKLVPGAYRLMANLLAPAQ